MKPQHEMTYCPKCGNAALDYRNGYPVRVAWWCHKCGLTAESGSYRDAATGKRTEIPTEAIRTRVRHGRRGRFT